MGAVDGAGSSASGSLPALRDREEQEAQYRAPRCGGGGVGSWGVWLRGACGCARVWCAWDEGGGQGHTRLQWRSALAWKGALSCWHAIP